MCISFQHVRAIARSMKRQTVMALMLVAGSQAIAKDITFVLDFHVNGRHAYYFVAQEKGFYKEQGLNVNIVTSSGAADAIRKVAAGQAELGFADAGALIMARANDNVQVKLLSIIYQKTPQALYAIEGNGIVQAKDLVGRKVADSGSSSNRLMFPAFAKAVGIDQEKVQFVVADGSALPAMLATGRADAIGQAIVGEPLLQKVVAPKKLVRLAYKDQGLDYYGAGIVASDEFIRNDPETARKFVAATLKGMQEAFRDPAAAGAILHRAQRQVDLDVGAAEIRVVAEVAQLPETPIGSLTEKKIDATIKAVSAALPLKRVLTAREIMASGFAPN